MDVAAPESTVGRTPPDVRGTSSPLSLSTFGIGMGAVLVVLGGTVVVQAVYAVAGGALTPSCKAQGLAHFFPNPPPGRGIKGSEGICHIVEGLRATPTTVALGLGIALGVVAIALGFGTFRRMDSKRRREQAIAGAVLGIQAVALALFVLWFRGGKTVFAFVRNFLNFTLLRPFLGTMYTGAKNTVILAAGGEIGGIIIGLTLAMFILSARKVVRAPARVYVNFFRGTPLIWQLSFFYFLFVFGLGLHLSSYKAALIVFSLNTGAYASEVFRAGIQSIERGQMEAARGLGFSYFQAMRYAIVPQAVRRVIPPLLNEFVILIKDTALVIVLGLLVSQYELYSASQAGYSATANATFFVASAIGYLAITLPMIGVVNAVERRLRSGLLGVGGMQ
jgi:polar amino acid transport system permease protein